MIDNYRDCANKWMFQFNEMQSCVIQFSKFSVKPDFDWIINQELRGLSTVNECYVYCLFEILRRRQKTKTFLGNPSYFEYFYPI
jgi:hypothetical protein